MAPFLPDFEPEEEESAGKRTVKFPGTEVAGKARLDSTSGKN